MRQIYVTAFVVTTFVLAGLFGWAPSGFAQESPRLNKIIEAIEAGRPAIATQDWRFIDMEHSPFSGERIQRVLTEMGEERDADGRLSLTPMIRIPQEGDEDFKWAIKQVLDLGGFGVIVPHVDAKEEAVRMVQAMRYPPTRDSAHPEPRGERGWGPGGAVRHQPAVGDGARRAGGPGVLHGQHAGDPEEPGDRHDGGRRRPTPDDVCHRVVRFWGTQALGFGTD